MEQEKKALIDSLARKYVWWKDPEQTLRETGRLELAIMDRGSFVDIQLGLKLLGEEAFKKAFQNPAPGSLRPRSYTYWNWVLFRIKTDKVPDLGRKIP